ncbi:MAG: hypothetical protein ACXW5U_26590 [Thermoanaerobaculia bacterium]
MSAIRTVVRRRRAWPWVSALSVLVIVVGAGEASASGVLFPTPIHLTREVTTPFSEDATVVEEYCHGNRVVSINGDRTAIADHAKGELTVIDFAAGTYSVTTFEAIAKLHDRNVRATAARTGEWRIEQRGGRVVASRPGEMIEVRRQDDDVHRTIRLTLDRELKLSREAVEALLGSGYPNRRDEASDAILGALRSPRGPRSNEALTTEDDYFLPLEYVVGYDLDGQRVETRNVVVRIGSELPPADRMAMPPGAKLVESDAVAARRLLDELDQ